MHNAECTLQNDHRALGRVRIIGVIDVLGGRAVHAQGGCRHGYRPIENAGGMSIQGDANALARMYVDRCGISELYVADLDAIAGGSEQDVSAIAALGVPVWLDAGVSTVSAARRARDRGASSVIIGLETLKSFSALGEIAEAIGPEHAGFSLDLRDGQPIAGDDAITQLPVDAIASAASQAGASTIIVLDLARVGSGRGVDLKQLEKVKRAAPGVVLLVGGGVRGVDDLPQLASVGCDGALVATALHGQGGIDLVRYATRQAPITNR